MLIKENTIDSIFKNSIILNNHFDFSQSIPVVENSRLGMNLIRYEDLLESGLSIEDISYTNNIDSQSIAVVVNEGYIVENPYLASYFNVVIEPVSEDCYESKLIDYLCNLCEETYDDSYLDIFIEETGQLKHQPAKPKTINSEFVGKFSNLNTTQDNRMTPEQRAKIGAKGASLLTTALLSKNYNDENRKLNPYKNTMAYYDYIDKENLGRRFERFPSNEKESNEYINKLKHGDGNTQYKIINKQLTDMHNLYKEAMHLPKSRIGKLIAKLRNAYHGFLLRANRAMDKNQAGFFKKIAAKILTWIDKLSAKLQLAAG